MDRVTVLGVRQEAVTASILEKKLGEEEDTEDCRRQRDLAGYRRD